MSGRPATLLAPVPVAFNGDTRHRFLLLVLKSVAGWPRTAVIRVAGCRVIGVCCWLSFLLYFLFHAFNDFQCFREGARPLAEMLKTFQRRATPGSFPGVIATVGGARRCCERRRCGSKFKRLLRLCGRLCRLRRAVPLMPLELGGKRQKNKVVYAGGRLRWQGPDDG